MSSQNGRLLQATPVPRRGPSSIKKPATRGSRALEFTHPKRSLVAAGGCGNRATLLLPGSAACLEFAFHVREDLRQPGLLISGQHVVDLTLHLHLVLEAGGSGRLRALQC